MKRIVLASALAAAASLVAPSARAYCPSYTPAITSGGQKCGVDPVAGKNPSVAEWQGVFAKVAGGSASWGGDGPTIGTMGSGCSKPKPRTDVPAHFPCQLMKAIAMQESGWKQFCVPDTPASQVGQPERTIVSFDCGYGVGQVTSGMHVGETPSFDRQRVAGDAVYNLATGTLILRDKWAATPCVGDNDPDVVEDWYTATWAYNGLAYSNNPNNPNLKANRGPYNPQNGGAYAYQERVWGWMEFPPTPEHWEKMEAAYPNRGDIGNAAKPPELPEPNCASPTSCAQTRPTHKAQCTTQTDAGVVVIAPDGGVVEQPDAGAPIEAAPSAQAESGCSCSIARSRNAGAAFGALAVFAFFIRRRRSPSNLTPGPSPSPERGGRS